MQKRGQFYLIAAVVIIGVIAGLTATYNTARASEEDTTIFSLVEEINFEGAQILENGAIHSLTEADVKARIEALIAHYADSNLETNFLAIYGTSSVVNFYFYNPLNIGEISYGNSIIVFPSTNRVTLTRNSNVIIIQITNEVSRTLNIPPGQFFFTVLIKDKQGERFIATPKSTG